MKENEGFKVEQVWIYEGVTLGGCGCGWDGKSDPDPIGETILTAGDEVPAGRCPECDSLVYPIEPEPKVKQGINPLTFRSEHPGQTLDLTLHRMGLMIGDENMSTISFTASDPKKEEVVSMVVLTEPQFLAAIGHLFPRGELQDVHIEKEGTEAEGG